MLAELPIIDLGPIAIGLKFYCLFPLIDYGVKFALKLVEEDNACILILYF